MRTALTVMVWSLLGLTAFGPATAAAQPPGRDPLVFGAKPPAPAKPAGLDVVPTDSFGFLTVNVGKLWDNPGLKPLREYVVAQKVPTETAFGVPLAEIDRLTLFIPSLGRDLIPGVVVTTRKPYNEARILKTLEVAPPDAPAGRRQVGNAYRLENGEFELLVLVDERTLLFLSKEGRDDVLPLAGLIGQLLAKKADGPLAAALAEAAKHDVAAGFDVRSLAGFLEWVGDREAFPYRALLKAQTATFAADFDKTAQLSLKLAFPDADAAKRAAPVLADAGKELATELGKDLDRRKDRGEPIQGVLVEAAIAVVKAAKVDADGATVSVTAELRFQETVAKLVAALPKSWSAAIDGARAKNNLKQLALAAFNYESSYGFFPGDVSPAADKPLAMSWRVQILPFVEQANLYNRLDYTKAWDDPANLKVLEKAEMPKLFEIPGRPAPKGHTYFRIFSLPKNAKGKDRPLLAEGKRGPAVLDITDGTSNTFLIVEAGEAVPWYKPDVLAYDGVLPLPPLGDKQADKFLVAFADGSVKALRRDKLDEKTLRALITIAGGEVVKLP